MQAATLPKRTFEIVLHVKPRPWKRPRFNGSRGFTDQDQVAATAEIRWLVQMKRPDKLEGPLYLRATFFLLRPKSAKKKAYPCVRPDLDNYGKMLLDALNGVCFVDDAQIVRLELTKVYGDPERIEFELGEL